MPTSTCLNIVAHINMQLLCICKDRTRSKKGDTCSTLDMHSYAKEKSQKWVPQAYIYLYEENQGGPLFRL